MNIVDYGLYTVKDEYFNTYKSKYFSDNKSENRPYYLSFTDSDGIIWLIPVSTQIINYGKKIADDVNRYGICIFYHIGKIYGVDRAFQIGNMFPITANYLKKEYILPSISNRTNLPSINSACLRHPPHHTTVCFRRLP